MIYMYLFTARPLCCASGGDGFSFQEIREGFSSRCCIACVFCNDWRLLAWNST